MKNHFMLCVLGAAILFAGCSKIEEIQAPVNEDAIASVTIQNGTAVLPLGGLDEYSATLNFTAKTSNGIVRSQSLKINHSEVADGSAIFRISLPEGNYRSYTVEVVDCYRETTYYCEADDDEAPFTVLANEEVALERCASYAPETKATVTATGRPWTGWNESNNVYSVGQYLGRYNIMQSFHVLTDGNIVYVQTKKADADGRKRNLRVVKCIPKSTKTSIGTEKSYNAMELDWFGHGGTVCVEEYSSSAHYIWIGCHGKWNADKAEAQGSQTIARFRWAGSQGNGNDIPYVLRTDMYDKTAKTTNLYVYKPSSSTYPYKDVGLTVYGSKVCIEHNGTGDSRWFKIYNLSAVKGLTPKSITVENAINAGTTTVLARNIAELTPICTITFDNPKVTTLSGSTKKLDFQGFDMIELSDRYRVYALYGESNGTTGNKAKIITKEYKFSTKAEANYECSDVYAFSHYSTTLKSKFPTFNVATNVPYCEVEGIRVSRNETDQGKKIYIGFATRDTNSSGPARANVLKYSRY